MKVVILAAGRGKRMGEYTENTTKAMLPLQSEKGAFSRKPMLQITIEACVKAGFTEFVIVVGYRKQDIMDHFGDGSKYNISIKYVTQHNICAGTANAVECTKFFFDGYDSVTEETPFFLIYGDVVPTLCDLEKMVQTHKHESGGESIANGVMAVRTVDDPQRYGVVETDDDGNILRIVEKSPNPPTNLINAGMYILPTLIFQHIKNTKLSERGEYELTESIQLLIDSGREMKTAVVSGLKDVGTKQVYQSLNSKL